MVRKRISIIVPCYNQGQYLSETLDSLISQSYQEWECIVVNDGSTDDSEDVAQTYCAKDNRIKYLFQENQGLATTRNNGIRQSSGEYILPLDADDKIDPRYLEFAIRRFEDFPDTKLVYCKGRLFGEINESWNLPAYSYNNFIWCNCIFCSAIYKRDDYNQTVGYNPNMKGGLEDWDFWLSLLGPNDVVYQIPEELFFYRKHGPSMLAGVSAISQQLHRKIYLNHPDVYSDYLVDIVYLGSEVNNLKEENALLKSQLIKARSSKSYRLGRFLLKPFRLFRNR